ncbi:MAG: peptidoglycan recognition family protein [Candidatus Melainabacteria bacterium]|nr:peptidoglycan recognition family protein [Candidatus Melainabacteria bacterium]
MAKRWQLIFSLMLVLSFVFPSTAYSRVSKSHSAIKRTTTKMVTRTTTRTRKVATTKSTRAKTKKIATRKRTAKKRPVRVASRFMWYAPINTSPLNPAVSARLGANFRRGLASRYSPQDLVRAGVFTHSPLRGGIRPRSQQISHLIIHSTETASPADARTVVKSWNHGLSHPGTQYIVDRDGRIHQTVDPKYATIHVNERRTLGGVTNDNSIGIEIVRAGSQKYTQVQLASLVQLVDYVQERYGIRNIYGHGQIQPSTRTDPVAFNWNLFSRNLATIRSATTQTAYKESLDEQG